MHNVLKNRNSQASRWQLSRPNFNLPALRSSAPSVNSKTIIRYNLHNSNRCLWAVAATGSQLRIVMWCRGWPSWRTNRPDWARCCWIPRLQAQIIQTVGQVSSCLTRAAALPISIRSGSGARPFSPWWRATWATVRRSGRVPQRTLPILPLSKLTRPGPIYTR